MVRKKWIIFLCCVGLLFLSPAAFAQVYFQDNFQNNSQINPSSTTYWDSVNHLVRLPLRPTANSISMNNNGNYVVVQPNQISWYAYDTTQNKMVLRNDLSIPASNPLGVAMRPDVNAYWAYDGSSIKRYDYTGTGMAYNPALSVLGLNGVLSVSAVQGQDTIAVLQMNAQHQGQVTLYRYDGNTMVPNQTFTTDVNEPVSVTMVPNTGDFVVAGQNQYGYFQYNPSINSYQRNTTLSDTGLSNVLVANDLNNGDVKILSSNSVQHDAFTGTQMQSVPMLGVNSLPSAPISMAANPSNYDFAYLDKQGNVLYYQFDQNTNTMIRNPAMEQAGLSVVYGYLKPKVYESTLITPPSPMNLAKLMVTENDDPTGTIAYQVSSDGGSTWTTITPGTWTNVPLGSQFLIQGTFDSGSVDATPRLLNIQLELTKLSLSNVRVTNMLFPGPNQVSALPTSVFPVYVKAGSEFTFMVDSTGFADQVQAVFTNGDTVNLTPQQATTNDANTWLGRYTPSIATPDQTSAGVTLIAYHGAASVTLAVNPFYVTDGNVSTQASIKLIQ